MNNSVSLNLNSLLNLKAESKNSKLQSNISFKDFMFNENNKYDFTKANNDKSSSYKASKNTKTLKNNNFDNSSENKDYYKVEDRKTTSTKENDYKTKKTDDATELEDEFDDEKDTSKTTTTDSNIQFLLLALSSLNSDTNLKDIVNKLNENPQEGLDFLLKNFENVNLENVNLENLNLENINLSTNDLAQLKDLVKNLKNIFNQDFQQQLKDVFKVQDFQDVVETLPKEIKDKIVSLMDNQSKIEDLNITNEIEAFEQIKPTIDKKDLNIKLNKEEVEDLNIEEVEVEIKPIVQNDKSSLFSNFSSQDLSKGDSDLESLEKKLSLNDENKNNFSLNIENLGSKISNKIKTLNIKNMANLSDVNILNQIINKSKNINKDNSVVQINLEPNELGKLTLKIALEKGVLSANFIAENEKIKNVIENNIEQLKKNLEDQGINIQSINVSVNSEEGFDRHKSILEALEYSKKNSKNINILESIEDDEFENISINNPYFIDDEFNELA